MKKTLLTLLTIVFIGSLSGVGHAASDPGSSNVDGGISIGKCAAKGGADFNLFLQSIMFSEGIYMGVYEQFFDVIERNQCQANDIMSLIQQQNSIRSKIRDAFLSCKSEKVPPLKRAFTEVSADIYYVRNVIDGKIAITLPFEIVDLKLESDEKAFDYPVEKLYSEMVENFVGSDKMTQKEFDIYFLRTQEKYEERKKSYVKCDVDTWKAVVDKWKEFTEDGGGTKSAAKDFKKGVAGRAEKISESATSVSLKSWASGLLTTNINDMEPKAAFEDFMDNIDDYIPNIESPTSTDIFNVYQEEESKFEEEVFRRRVGSSFEAKYLGVSDSSIKVAVDRLKEFDDTVKSAYPLLEAIEKKSDSINSRQCSNK